MGIYQPTKLFPCCVHAILFEQHLQHKTKEPKNLYLIAQKKMETLYKEAYDYISKNPAEFEDILYNPKELFYHKKQNRYGFYKEFLELEIVKKLLDALPYIFKMRISIQELDEVTHQFTQGKEKTFFSYFYNAQLDRKRKLANRLAIEKLISTCKTTCYMCNKNETESFTVLCKKCHKEFNTIIDEQILKNFNAQFDLPESKQLIQFKEAKHCIKRTKDDNDTTYRKKLFKYFKKTYGELLHIAVYNDIVKDS